MARVLGIGTALPRHRYSQGEIKRAYAGMFKTGTSMNRYLSLFDRAGVRTRNFAKPLSYYRRRPGFGERNRDYLRAAMDLSEAAVKRCLRAAGAAPRDIGYLVCVTTTGLATPSLDARLVERLGLPPDVRRNPIFGTGCASGALGLSRAAEFLAGNPGRKALVVSAELCSLTLQRGDPSVENLLACALFADGAAAALLGGGEGEGPRLAAWESHLFPNSTHVMGWDFGEEGMKIILSPEVPELVRGKLRPLVERFLARQGLGLEDVRHWILHPGGAKVIRAYEEVFGLAPRHTRWSRRCLGRLGNLSSASVLFMLGDLKRSGTARPGDRGLLLALGPGFAAELGLLRW